MKIVTRGQTESGDESKLYNPPEIGIEEHLSEDDNGPLLRSRLEIHDFLRQRMAVCLPRIGAMGKYKSAGMCAIAPSRRKPAVTEGRQEITLAEVIGC